MPPHLTSYQSLVTSKARRRSKPDERPKTPRPGSSELEEVLVSFLRAVSFWRDLELSPWRASSHSRSINFDLSSSTRSERHLSDSVALKKPDLTGLEFSYLNNIPIDSLRVLKGFLSFMASSVQANINNSRNATGRPVLHTISNSSMATSKDSGAGREDDAWKRCLELDGDCCVITGASHPHVYQILPFAWSKTKTNLRTQQMIPALEVVVDLKPSNVKYEAVTKLRQNIGCTDPLWNVYYGRANCLEEDFAQIHVQFLWMPRNIYRRATKQRVQRKPEVRISHRFAQSPTTAVA
ncbi:hypothetical protein BFJ65_g3974 [Fusarium oxysporum f. sp. cepae]|uniref:HNH nuclease domain-containing protein n=1 Tax=Fusarium oxysporum f. sp. cepae TaxID=396571 RepID=A0A3L6P2P2_FUSOX|nr:hypothetical protein BFJ65_g3974 [Fusarium oxysporum f. sp. cepae]